MNWQPEMILNKIGNSPMLNDQIFNLGDNLTAIIGQNGTMKSTLLGMIAEPFRFEEPKDSNEKPFKTIDGKNFQLKFSDAFKFSDGSNGLERAGCHVWIAHINASVYSKERYRAKTIARTNKEKNDIRTWSGEGKGKGEKHAQLPVIYLSLKRLVPIGEERSVQHKPIDLTTDERDWFEKYHKKILLLQQNMKDAELVNSRNKTTLGFVTERYDSLTNSSGQDNVGKILMSVLSFSRLKQKLDKDYKGALLLIDEIDATLYPAAQKQLIKALMKFSHEYNLQIVFTTHSTEVTEVLYDERYQRQCKILYLEARDDEVVIHENLSLSNVLAHLRAETIAENLKKINVFTEDDVARIFARNLLPKGMSKKLNFMKVCLGSGELGNLHKVGLNDFRKGIIVYDGDVNIKRSPFKSKNSVSLPGGLLPEKVFFVFLKSLFENDEFWGKLPGEYSKQICFSGYESCSNPDKEQAKDWFKAQKSNFGRSCSKLFTRWKKSNPKALEQFQKDIVAAFKAVGGNL
jgi:AAA15 family ATPase/GTPase